MKQIISITLMTVLSSPLIAEQATTDAQPTMSDIFMQKLDMDADRKVSSKEFLKPYEAQFAHLDSNQDGYIDEAEITAFDAKMRSRSQQTTP